MPENEWHDYVMACLPRVSLHHCVHVLGLCVFDGGSGMGGQPAWKAAQRLAGDPQRRHQPISKPCR